MSEFQKSVVVLTLFIGLVAALVLGALYYFVGREMVTKYQDQASEAIRETKRLETQLQEIDDLLAQKDEVAERAEHIRKLARRLPTSPQAPGFLNALRSILSQTGLVQQLVAGEEAESKKRQVTKRSILQSRTSTALYTEIPYIVKAHGRYHAIGQFLTLLEQNADRFMRVKYMKISNNLFRPSVHPLELVVGTFMFNEMAEVER